MPKSYWVGLTCLSVEQGSLLLACILQAHSLHSPAASEENTPATWRPKEARKHAAKVCGLWAVCSFCFTARRLFMLPWTQTGESILSFHFNGNVAALPRSSNSTSGYQHSPILQTVSLAPLGLLGIACGIGFGHVARTLAAMKLSESSPSFPMSVKMCQVSSVKSKLNRVEFSHWAEVPIHLRPQAASGSAGRCRPGLQGRLGKALVLIGTTGRDTPEVVA